MSKILQRCKEAKKPVEIIYLAKNGCITQRTILVLEIKRESISAFCYLRNTKRTFLHQNILSCSPVKGNRLKENAI
jgi:predicted DNA-binding transcriptional regulator YafY